MEVEKRYKVQHIHSHGDIILLCMRPLEKLRPPPFSMQPANTSHGMEQMTSAVMKGVSQMMPQRENLVMVELTQQQFEKLGKPNVFDEISLTLRMSQDAE